MKDVIRKAEFHEISSYLFLPSNISIANRFFYPLQIFSLSTFIVQNVLRTTLFLITIQANRSNNYTVDSQ